MRLEQDFLNSEVSTVNPFPAESSRMPDALCPGTPNLLWNRDLVEQGHHRTKGSLNMSLTNPPVPPQANSGRLKFFTFSHSDCFCPRDHETSEQTDPDEFKQKTKASVWKHNT